VGFRYFVQRQAMPLGVAGFVRNLPDRRVEIVAEGPAASVQALLDAVREGPAGAVVHNVSVVWETPRGEAGFVIQAGAVHE
jgi:acylphosphatase